MIWCAKREEDLFHSQRGPGRRLAVSLLGFDGSLRLRMAGVLEVVDVVRRKVAHKAAAVPVTPNDGPSPIHATDFASYHPSILSTLTLDGLFAAIHEQLSIGETATPQELLSIFTHTAQPTWFSIGRWLRDGWVRWRAKEFMAVPCKTKSSSSRRVAFPLAHLTSGMGVIAFEG